MFGKLCIQGAWHGLCYLGPKKLPGASPVADRANIRWLQDRPKPLAKAKSISDAGSTSGITDLRTGGVWVEDVGGVRMCERSSPADTQACKKEEDVLHVPEQRFLCIPWGRPWWGRTPPYSPWRSMVDLISTCSLWRTTHQHRWVPEGGCDSMGNACWNRLHFAEGALNPTMTRMNIF